VSNANSIKLKIALVFGLYVLLMAIIGMFGLAGLKQLNDKIHSSFEDNTIPIADLSNARVALFHIRLQMRDIERVRDPSKTPGMFMEIRGAQMQLKKAVSRYDRPDLPNSHEQELAATARSVQSRFDTLTDQAITAFRSGDWDSGHAIQERLVPVADAFHDNLMQLAQLSFTQAQQYANQSAVTFNRLFWVLGGLLAVGAIIATGMSIYLTKAIARPLDQAMNVAHHIAGGRLENRIVITSGDEFGRLLESLQTMDRRLSDTVRRIKASTDAVAVAAEQIASGNRNLSSRTEEQAVSLEETAASMTQLTETVKQNAANAHQANVFATSASDMADTGNEAVQEMVGMIERISGSSNKISEITGIIESIAFQTNILALNAAVEAARAGEQGRGFAVVASEVRGLAQRSAAAAKEIKDLITSSVAMILVGSKQAGEVSATMGRLKQAIKQVSDIVGEIAAASEEQSRGIEQVNHAVNQMDEVTQHNAALGEESAAAAQALDEQAKNLKQAVSAFKVSDTEDQCEDVQIAAFDVQRDAAVIQCEGPHDAAHRGVGPTRHKARLT
jgi:methyl-accepting chemotaxis protein